MNETTLADMLDTDQLADDGFQQDQITEALGRAQTQLGSAGEGLKASFLRRGFATALKKVLDVPIADIVARAWSTLPAVRKYGDPSKAPFDQVHVVPMSFHCIRSTHQPSIDLNVDGVPIDKIGLTLMVKLVIQAGALHIHQGAIQAVSLGKCEGSITVIAGPVTLAEKKKKVFNGAHELPLRHPLSLSSS